MYRWEKQVSADLRQVSTAFLFLQIVEMKREMNHRSCAFLFPVGYAGVQVAAWGLYGLAKLKRRSSHGAPLLCPPRQAGLWAACQGSWLGNRYLWATGKVSHLRITHSQRRCMKKKRRQKEKDSGRVAVLSCSLDHEEKKKEKCKRERQWHVFGAEVCFG